MPRKVLYDKTGIQIMNFNSVFQLDTLRRNNCSALAAAKKILFIPDALAYLLTGEMITEYTIASTAQMIDPRTKEWDADILTLLGLKAEDFGKMTMPGEKIGVLTEEGLPAEEIRELVHIAHEEGMAVMSHANGARTVEAAAKAGVDSVEHGAYLNGEALHAMQENGCVWVPTLSTTIVTTTSKIR